MWKRQLILSTLWLAAVGWYWREYVPLLPTRSAELQFEAVWVGWNPEGHAVVSGAELDATRVFVKSWRGPISIWRVPELERLSEQLGPEDEIEEGAMSPEWGLVVTGGAGGRRIVDVTTGAALEDVPQDVLRVSFGPDADPKALFIRKDSVTLRDPRLSKDLWTVTGITAKHAWFQRHFVQLRNVVATGTAAAGLAIPPDGFLLLDAKTGDVETRFDAIRPFDSVSISEDDRWALVHNSFGSSQICDALTGRPLWTLKGKFGQWPRFDTTRNELVLRWATPKGEVRESRWNCFDGTLLEGPQLSGPPESVEWADRTTDASGRYAIDTTSPRGLFQNVCARYVNPALKATGSDLRLPEECTIRVLRDLSTDEVVGPLPTDRYVQFIPGGSAAVGIGGRRIDVFEFPARRDWMWLIWRGVVPVSVVWGGGGLWWAFRRRGRVE